MAPGSILVVDDTTQIYAAMAGGFATSSSDTGTADAYGVMSMNLSNYWDQPEPAPRVRTKPPLPRPESLSVPIPPSQRLGMRAAVRLDGRGYG